MRKRWTLSPLSDKRLELARALDISPITAQLLINRNIRDAHEAKLHLEPSLKKLHSPRLLPDIEKAVARIHAAVKRHEQILLCGDYDVDGITSLGMMASYFKGTPVRLSIYIPHRIKEGYGFKDAAVNEAVRKKASLIICVDCGTNAHAQAEKARSHGIDVVVIDHHEVTSAHTHALLINPKRKDSVYPFKELCSAALTFKVIQALSGNDAYHLLDLAVLATIADVAPLVNENRIIVKEGMPYLKQTKNQGILELMDKTRLNKDKLSTFHIGFLLGPRINAAGRIGNAYDSLNLLIEENPETVKNIAAQLHALNEERQKMCSNAFKEAAALVEQTTDFSKDSVIVVEGDWHPGIIGIVASRISELYYRPAFIISFPEGAAVGKGSARSIENFHVTEALQECASLLVNFGGHGKAAGIEVKRDNLGALKIALNKIAAEKLPGEQLIPSLAIDYELPFTEITKALIEEIELLKPFGEGNPAPLFMTNGVNCKTVPRAIGKGRYSFYVTDGNKVFEALISESSGLSTLLQTDTDFDIVYYLSQKTFNGHEQITLNIVDLKTRQP